MIFQTQKKLYVELLVCFIGQILQTINFTERMYIMKNSVVVITGGNGGIGNIVVSKLLKEKSKVIVLDINESDNLNIKNNLDYEFIKTDVIDYMQLKNVHDIIKNKYNHIYSLLEITTCINGQNIVLDMGQSL